MRASTGCCAPRGCCRTTAPWHVGPYRFLKRPTVPEGRPRRRCRSPWAGVALPYEGRRTDERPTTFQGTYSTHTHERWYSGTRRWCQVRGDRCHLSRTSQAAASNSGARSRACTRPRCYTVLCKSCRVSVSKRIDLTTGNTHTTTLVQTLVINLRLSTADNGTNTRWYKRWC